MLSGMGEGDQRSADGPVLKHVELEPDGSGGHRHCRTVLKS